jgi:hypothetical protein
MSWRIVGGGIVVSRSVGACVPVLGGGRVGASVMASVMGGRGPRTSQITFMTLGQSRHAADIVVLRRSDWVMNAACKIANVMRSGYDTG